ncbi:hypothetical protein [Candidatus Magnetaquicoccus inordinatus]|uniref:hypothetical protein n=1 Tax=Candidatus Magnetaquicoccus inordinatus TaxID=2496818 RepID=UPI00102BC4E6|nr:hypothetical protein [Candidatus Magnetaquicoccus inordinatus]
MSILEDLKLKFRPELQNLLQQDKAKEYHLNISGYVVNSLRWLETSYPKLSLFAVSGEDSASPQPVAEKIYLNW